MLSRGMPLIHRLNACGGRGCDGKRVTGTLVMTSPDERAIGHLCLMVRNIVVPEERGRATNQIACEIARRALSGHLWGFILLGGKRMRTTFK